jgi:hypothetical protein
MTVVGGVAVVVVDVVQVVTVLDRLVTATLAVVVALMLVDPVAFWLALVPMPVVVAVGMAVVQVMGVVPVADGGVATSLPVLMIVLGVGVVVGNGHVRLLSVPCRTASWTMCATCSSARQ